MPERREETSGYLCDSFRSRYGLRHLFRASLLGMQSEGVEPGRTQGPTARTVQS